MKVTGARREDKDRKGVCGGWLFGCERLGPPEGWTWRVREVATNGRGS